MADRAAGAGVARLTAELVLDARCALGEGPRWDGVGERLEWVDMARGTWHRWETRRGVNAAAVSARRLGGRVSVVEPRAGGGRVVAVDGTVTLLDPDGFPERRVQVLSAEDGDLVLNDGGCDGAGRLWVGSASAGGAARGALHRLDPGAARAEVALDDVGMANGIGWSPDGRTLYFADSAAGRVDAFDFDVQEGALGARRTVVSIPAGEGLPDGLCVDADGCLWLAVWGAGEVRRHGPDGRLLARVAVGASQVTSCRFGGPAGDVLWITTARAGLDPDALARERHAGGVFAVEAGVRGLPGGAFGG